MEYKWSFGEVKVQPMVGQLPNVITDINYRLTLEHEGREEFVFGRIEIGPPNPSSFTSFSNLTPEKIQAMVLNTIGTDGVNGLRRELAEKMKKPQASSASVRATLPFNEAKSQAKEEEAKSEEELFAEARAKAEELNAKYGKSQEELIQEAIAKAQELAARFGKPD